MNRELAPILLFTYKRLETLKATVESLKKNTFARESDLYIFSDASKGKEDSDKVRAVREYLQTIDGFNTVKIFTSTHNMGLANSIITGVSRIIDEHEKVIVLEDDLTTTTNFLCFMNECLNKYEPNLKVFSVSGYSFNLGEIPSYPYDAYFLNRGWSWGWATWKNRWNLIDWDVKNYAQFKMDFNARRQFSTGGSDLNRMLDKQMDGRLDSWAIRAFYSQFKNKSYTIYPVSSKVYNNGFDEDATHTKGAFQRYIPDIDTSNKIEFHLPEKIEQHNVYQARFIKKLSIKARLESKVLTFLNYLFK